MCKKSIRWPIVFQLALNASIFFSGGIYAFGQDQNPKAVLVRLYSSASDSRVETLVSEDASQITTNDLATGVDVTVSKTDRLKIVKPLSRDDAATYAGLSTVVGWKLGQMTAKEKPVGKFASITSQDRILHAPASVGLASATQRVLKLPRQPEEGFLPRIP